MNDALVAQGIKGAVYGESSAFKILLGVDCEPVAGDRSPHSLPLPMLYAGTPSEVGRLMQLALLNRGVYFFGTGGLLSSVHEQREIEIATLRAGCLRVVCQRGELVIQNLFGVVEHAADILNTQREGERVQIEQAL